MTTVLASEKSYTKAGYAITPSDIDILDPTPSYIYVGGVGDITVQFETGTDVLLTAVPAGTVLPISPVRVMSTNTTATALVAIRNPR